MSTPIPHPANTIRSSVLSEAAGAADPARVRGAVDDILSRLVDPSGIDLESEDTSAAAAIIDANGCLLDEAHEVLLASLSAVGER